MATNELMYVWTRKYQGKHLSPLRSIKLYCKEQCCCGDTKSWKDCTFTACLLYKYRLGKGTRFQRKKHNSTPNISVKIESSTPEQSNLKEFENA